MSGRLALLLIGVILATPTACGTSAPPEAVSVPTTATAEAPSSSTTTTATTSTTSTADSAAPAALDLPLAEYALPDGVRIHSVALGDEQVVVAGWSEQGEFLAPADQLDSVVPVSDLFPKNDPTTEAPTISSLLWFRGRFFAFTMFDQTAGPSAPTVLTSVDGRVWEVGAMSVVADAGLFYTPDSPADPQHAGVGGAAVATSEGQPSGLAATGWGIHRGEVTAMLWESTDGDTWRSSPLPNQLGFADEVGLAVASSSAGTIVWLGGPLHTGVGTIVRHRPGDQWESVPVIDLNFASGIGANAGYLCYLEASMDAQPAQLHWRDSHDSEWTTTALPPEVAESGWNLNLEVSGAHDPVLVQRLDTSGPVLWTLDREIWGPAELSGDHLVSIDADHIATTTESSLFVYDRRG